MRFSSFARLLEWGMRMRKVSFCERQGEARDKKYLADDLHQTHKIEIETKGARQPAGFSFFEPLYLIENKVETRKISGINDLRSGSIY